MASQCHCLAVQSSISRVYVPCTSSSSSSSTSFNLRVNQPSVFLHGQRLQSQRLPRISHSSSSRPQCVSSTAGSQEFDKNEDGRQQNKVISSILAMTPEPIRVFPWGKAGSLFLQRLLHQFWTVGKWLAIPVLAVSMLSEVSYTLLQDRVLIVPVGVIGGIAFAGMMKETAVELSSSLEAGQVPWHLVLLGLFFGALKLIAPYLPLWGRVSVPHFANGGLWHVIKLVIDWRKQHAERSAEQI